MLSVQKIIYLALAQTCSPWNWRFFNWLFCDCIFDQWLNEFNWNMLMSDTWELSFVRKMPNKLENSDQCIDIFISNQTDIQYSETVLVNVSKDVTLRIIAQIFEICGTNRVSYSIWSIFIYIFMYRKGPTEFYCRSKSCDIRLREVNLWSFCNKLHLMHIRPIAQIILVP